MPGKHLTPSQKTEALTLRSAGYTVSVISDRTGISVSSLKRLFKEHGIHKGDIKEDAVRLAAESLINDENAIEQIKTNLSSLILDDIALTKRLREAMALAADELRATDTTEALQVMRAVSSAAVALKSTSETLHRSLELARPEGIADQLPQLSIEIMTDEEVERVKQDARLKHQDSLALISEDEIEEVV